MNEKAKTALRQYRDLVTAWGLGANMQAYENGCQLIEYIESKLTNSTVGERQNVKSINWESILSVLPTEEIQAELKRRIFPEYKEDLRIMHEKHTCGVHLTARKWGDKFEVRCEECNISGTWQDTEEKALNVFGEFVL